MKDQAVTREEALQNKILMLEAEKSRRESELRLLRQSKHKVGFPLRLHRGKLSCQCLDCCNSARFILDDVHTIFFFYLQAEKQFEMRLKDLQLSLEQSESHKKSIQSYVDFLKSSYTTMFHEGPQATYFSSSYFR